MPWTPLTFPPNSLLTSAKLTQLQQNFEALVNQDSGAPPGGQAGGLALHDDVAALQFAGALVQRSSNQSAASGADVIVEWQAAARDTDGVWSALTPTRLTAPAGVTLVQLSANIELDWNVEYTSLEARMLMNGTSFFGTGSFRSSGGAHTQYTGQTARMNFVSAAVEVSTGDYFEVSIRQLNTEVTSRFIVAGDHTWFEMRLLA